MAGTAQGFASMDFQGFTKRRLVISGRLFAGFERRDVSRRGRRRNSQNIIENKQAALDRGSAGGVGSDYEYRPVRQNPAPRAVRGQRHLSHLAANDIGN